MLLIYLNKYTSIFEEGIWHRKESILSKSAMEDRKNKY